MKISIITACYNSEKTIEDTLKSIQSQTYPDIESIVIDGQSKDRTNEIVSQYSDIVSIHISEPDKGIYDAMNKGIALATGDVVGILNSDDFYADKFVIEKVAKVFENQVDSVYGDLVYVNKNDTSKLVRYWQSKKIYDGIFQQGWYPAHPTFFVKRYIYEKYGYFNLDFKIAADCELMLRFLEKHKISASYLPEILVKMRTGGASNQSIINIIKANIECYNAWKVNGLYINPIRYLLKPLSKVIQFFRR